MRFKYDKNNIPYLSRGDIENVAERFLKKYAPLNLRKPLKLPIYNVVEELQKRGKVKFDFTQELGFNPQGRTLGKTILNKKEILIDKNFAQNRSSKRLYFTIAHEIGHFVFHTSRPIRADNKPQTTIIDSENEIYFDSSSKELKTVLDFVEWQANCFASSVLMPIDPFHKALKKVQKDIGINRNRGIIFINKQSSSKRDLNITVAHLSDLFNVPKVSVKIKLNKLKLIVDRSERSLHDIKRIGEVIKS